MAVASAVVLLGLSIGASTAGAQSSEPMIVGHPGQISRQAGDGTNCAWPATFSWDVWNNTQSPYALTSVAYRGFWEIRDGPNDYHVPIDVQDGGVRARVQRAPGRNA